MTNELPIVSQKATTEISEADFLSLTRAILFLAQRLDRPCEETQARRLLSEVIRSQPGTTHESWWIWLLSAGRSLGMTLRVSDIQPRDLLAILRSGGCVVAESRVAQAHQVTFRKLDPRQVVLVGTPPATLPDQADAPSEEALLRVIIAATEPQFGTTPHRHEKPWTILWQLLAPEHKDLWVELTLSGIAGLLLLSVPITAQQLVRTVTFATLYQPIVVLSLLLLGLLGFVAVLQALQIYVAEIIQRRLFVRIAGEATRHLTQADANVWRQFAMPELVNRFLEVAIVQKVTAALAVDGITILLTTLISMSVMAFYHPFLLGYDILLLVLLTTILIGFGRNGVKTAIQESRSKYAVLSWLEDMARCPNIFRTGDVELLAMQRTDVFCAEYLRARQSHYSILMRQIVLILVLQVIATTTLLGLGGFLVLNEQLTLGQLVAAELIVAMIVASFAKLGKHLEGWYDLLASVDKLSHIFHLPTEPHDGLIGISRQGPAEVVLWGDDVHQTDAPDHVSAQSPLLRVAPGETAALLNWNPSLIRDLADSLRGLHGLPGPKLYMDRVQVDNIRKDVLRQHVAVAGGHEFLPVTVAENIHLSRPGVTEADIREACETTGLTEELRHSGLSLSTQVLPTGWPLNALQQRRLILARTLAGKPRVLLIDHLCDAFSEEEIQQLWRQILNHQPRSTILVATVREDLAREVGHVTKGPRTTHNRQHARTH